MGIPISKTLGIWASSYFGLGLGVRVAGNAYIIRGFENGDDRRINSSIHSVSFIAPLNEDTRKSVRKSPYAPVSIFPFHFLSDKMLSRRFRQILGQVLVCKKNHETTAVTIII